MYESRAYDNQQGDPVVVLVVTGTHDVSRLVNLLNGGSPSCEHIGLGRRVVTQVRQRGGGRAALDLLVAHGGPDYSRWEPGSGAELIAAERRRQIEAKGYTAEHDADHDGGELMQAALCYLDEESSAVDWPWAELPTSKGEDRLRDMVKAGALIAAEIDRYRAWAYGSAGVPR